MTRKLYINPSVKVIRLEGQSNLLASSGSDEVAGDDVYDENSDPALPAL